MSLLFCSMFTSFLIKDFLYVSFHCVRRQSCQCLEKCLLLLPSQFCKRWRRKGVSAASAPPPPPPPTPPKGFQKTIVMRYHDLNHRISILIALSHSLHFLTMLRTGYNWISKKKNFNFTLAFVFYMVGGLLPLFCIFIFLVPIQYIHSYKAVGETRDR